MQPKAHVIGDSALCFWGLTPGQRLERALIQAGIEQTTLTGGARASRCLMIRGDQLYDERILAALREQPGVVLTDHDGVAVAANVDGGQVGVARALLTGESPDALPDLPRKAPTELVSGYNQKLRKLDPPYVVAATQESHGVMEQHLFDASYKGVVDFITKWVWPRPARVAVGWCARHGVSPNQVTSVGAVLTVLAGVFFWFGYFGLGLVAGTLMTFLDTVDGKLARVTLTSSPFGNIFDHGIDIIHPPLWYLAWGIGCAHYGHWTVGAALAPVLWLMLAGYIGGRVAEGVFKTHMGGLSIFIWRPVDSWHRLITARRNPNMCLLAAGWLLGRPDLGLVAVALWHVLSTAALWATYIQALKARRQRQAPISWLRGVDPARPGNLSEKIFTRRPIRL